MDLSPQAVRAAWIDALEDSVRMKDDGYWPLRHFSALYTSLDPDSRRILATQVRGWLADEDELSRRSATLLLQDIEEQEARQSARWVGLDRCTEQAHPAGGAVS